MDEKLMMQIVEAVVSELKAGGSVAAGEGAGYQDGLPGMLVIGKIENVPTSDREGYRCYDIEDYKKYQNINRYQKVMITRLSLTQLSDIAQGRDASPESCAVVNALLAGVEVVMTESALVYRKYAGKSSSRLYQVIENHAKTIQTYGVKLLKPAIINMEKPAAPPKYQAPKLVVPQGHARPNADKLITEEVARKLAAPGDSIVVISRDAIVTPSAWDYFKYQGIEVVRN